MIIIILKTGGFYSVCYNKTITRDPFSCVCSVNTTPHTQVLFCMGQYVMTYTKLGITYCNVIL